MSIALLLVDHGSTHEAANQMLIDVAQLVQNLQPEIMVEYAHMELAEPTLEQGIAACVEKGALTVVVHPFMLSPGRHATVDIPRMVNKAADYYPGINISVTEPLGLHVKIAEVILIRANLISKTQANLD